MFLTKFKIGVALLFTISLAALTAAGGRGPSDDAAKKIAAAPISLTQLMASLPSGANGDVKDAPPGPGSSLPAGLRAEILLSSIS